MTHCSASHIRSRPGRFLGSLGLLAVGGCASDTTHPPDDGATAALTTTGEQRATALQERGYGEVAGDAAPGPPVAAPNCHATRPGPLWPTDRALRGSLARGHHGAPRDRRILVASM